MGHKIANGILDITGGKDVQYENILASSSDDNKKLIMVTTIFTDGTVFTVFDIISSFGITTHFKLIPAIVDYNSR